MVLGSVGEELARAKCYNSWEESCWEQVGPRENEQPLPPDIACLEMFKRMNFHNKLLLCIIYISISVHASLLYSYVIIIPHRLIWYVREAVKIVSCPMYAYFEEV